MTPDTEKRKILMSRPLISRLIVALRFLKWIIVHRDRWLEVQQQRSLYFAPPGHFYSPLVDQEWAGAQEGNLEPCERGVGNRQGLATAIEMREEAQEQLLSEFISMRSDYPFLDGAIIGIYSPNNTYFHSGDLCVLYGMMKKYAPASIVEVGSGFSTAAMIDINGALGRECKITCIEPYPDRLQAQLAGLDSGLRPQVLVESVRNVDLRVFSDLSRDDILFVDSSHVLKSGSDLEFILFEVLPLLAPGVLVHFHDIYWPWTYPARWLKNGCSWNEAQALRLLLTGNQGLEIVYFNSFASYRWPQVIRKGFPEMLQDTEHGEPAMNAGLWLRTVGPKRN